MFHNGYLCIFKFSLYFFDKKLLLRLETESSEINAQLVTTEKDAIRLPHEFRKSVGVRAKLLGVDPVRS